MAQCGPGGGAVPSLTEPATVIKFDWPIPTETAWATEGSCILFSPFAPVESFFLAKVSIGERKRCKE